MSVSEYLASSRLHFLGTWKHRITTFLEEYISKGKWAVDIDEKYLDKIHKYRDDVDSFLSGGMSIVLHLDMDCFFYSIAEKLFVIPTNEPGAVVSGMGDGSDVCSANYIAREHGVYGGQYVLGAKEACPGLNLIPVSSELLEKADIVWKRIFRILCMVFGTDNVEGASCDEAYIYVKGVELRHIEKMLRSLKELIFQITDYKCSIGASVSNIMAKINSDRAKPFGTSYIVTRIDIDEFLRDFPVMCLPGVGRSTLKRLVSLGFKTCGDIQDGDHGELEKTFGVKKAKEFVSMSQGLDTEKKDVSTKSCSAEKNFGLRNLGVSDVIQISRDLISQASVRLQNRVVSSVVFRLKIATDDWVEPLKHMGHGKCTDWSKNVKCVDLDDGIGKLCSLIQELPFGNPQRIRGIGVSLVGSEVEKQKSISIFNHPSSKGYQKIMSDDEKLYILKRKYSGILHDGFDYAHATLPDYVRVSAKQDNLPECPVCGNRFQAWYINHHVNSHFS